MLKYINESGYVVLHRAVDGLSGSDRTNEGKTHRGRALCRNHLAKYHLPGSTIHNRVTSISVSWECDSKCGSVKLKYFYFEAYVVMTVIIKDSSPC